MRAGAFYAAQDVVTIATEPDARLRVRVLFIPEFAIVTSAVGPLGQTRNIFKGLAGELARPVRLRLPASARQVSSD